MLASNQNENLWVWGDFKRLSLKWEVAILALLKWRRKSLWQAWWLISGLFTHWNNFVRNLENMCRDKWVSHTRLWPQQPSLHKGVALPPAGEEFQEFHCPATGTSMPHTESQLRWITTAWVQSRVSRDQYLLSGCRITSLLQDQGVGSSTVGKPCSARARIYGKVSGKWRKSREAERAVCVLQVKQRTACEDEL